MRLSDAALEGLRQTLARPEVTGTRYTLVKKLGAGGMGVVWEAEDAALARRVALKIIELPERRGDVTERLFREARVLASLEHPGIVPVHDAGTLPDGRLFYAMKRVEGKRLDEHLDGVPSVPDRLRLFLRVCDAVAFAHTRAVLHRDLKPQNVMVGPFGEVLVMDWGLAKILRGGDDPPASENGAAAASGSAAAGTPGFMAPEQSEPSRPLDVRTDVYGLGALLAAIVPTPRPRPLEAIAARATAAQPAGRYADVPSLASDVVRYLDGERVLAYREHPLAGAARLLRRHRVAALLIAAYLAARAVAVLVSR